MPTIEGEYYVGSLLEKIPFIANIEGRVDKAKLSRWQMDYWWLSVVASVIYLMLLYAGKKFMKHREPYNFRNALFLWNVGLAVFSIMGTLSCVPNLVHLLYRKGFVFSSCRTMMYDNSSLQLWNFFFGLSKIAEFGDTFFLVVRKSRVQFLHWYHHVTVLVLTWYGLGARQSNGHWFGAMNYAVHSVMYSYFAVYATGKKISPLISKLVTVLQIAQMFVGIAVNFAIYIAFQRGEVCDVNSTFLYMGSFIYGTYAFLFIKFYFAKYSK